VETGATLASGPTSSPDVRTTDAVAVATPSAPTADYPTLEVEVVHDDGTPVPGGDAYALPAGTAGRDGTEGVAYAQIDEGKARIVLPRAGTYDIGALFGVLDVLRTDVVVPAAEPVVLRMPRLGRVEVSLDPRLAALLRPPVRQPDSPTLVYDQVQVRLEPVDPRPRVSYPGRQDRAGRDVLTVAIGGPNQDPQAAQLVAGRRYRVLASARLPVEATPSEVVPPAAIRVATTGWTVLLDVRLDSRSKVLERPGVVAVAYDLDGARLGENSWRLEQGQHPSQIKPVVVRLSVPVRRGRVAWSGSGVAAGGVDFEIGPDGEARAPVVIDVLDPPAPPPAPPPGRTTRVRTLPPSDGGRLSGASVWFASPDDGSPFQQQDEWDEDRQEGLGSAVEPAIGAIALGWTDFDDFPSHVAGPVIGAPDGTTFVLRRGGHVVLVPRRLPPPGLQLVVRRADGGLFPADGEATSEVVVEPGLVLGPFLPGPVRLAFRLGGVEAGEATVEVLAGEHVPLVLGARGPKGD
jgi:hypothetical protein